MLTLIIMDKSNPRYLASYLKKDLKEKILIIAGPRQSGKTMLSKMLSPRHDYLNYYDSESRLRIDKKQWDRSQSYVVFDESIKGKGTSTTS